MATINKLLQFEDLQPGQRVRVTQTVERRARDWQSSVTGIVLATEVSMTGSWFAHSKDDRLWLRRVRLQKDDGEVSLLNVDGWTRLELL